jgi:predicted Zn-dependent peptidase
MFLNSKFEKKEIEREKGVVIEELNMYEDLPPQKVAELFERLMYGDQPAGWPVGGQKEIIQKLSRQNFLQYRSEHYVAQATTVVLAGRFDEEKTLKKLRDVFQNMPVAKKFDKLKTVESQSRPEIFLQSKELDQTHLVLGCRAFDVFDNRKYALDVLADALGGGMSSRLFQKVREQLGAAYYVSAATSYQTDCGQLTVKAGIDHKKIKEVLRGILREMERFIKETMSDQELQRAKDHLNGRLILELETSDAQAVFYGGQEIITKTLQSPEEISQKIQLVTAGDIMAVAQDVFKNDRLNMALIGPYKNKAQFENILHF